MPNQPETTPDTTDDGYKIVGPHTTQRGIKCGLCGMKFDYGKAYGYYCQRAKCPVQIKAT